MSRIGKKPIPIPQGVEASINEGWVDVKGPLGSVKQVFPVGVTIELDKGAKILQVKRPDDQKKSKAFQGLTRALIANAVQGVVTGFQKSLSIVGTGFSAKLKGKHLEINVGFCLPVVLMIPEGIKVELPNPTSIVLKSCDKHLVGQFAATIRAIRPPEPYKGKGIRYLHEVVKLKARKGVGATAKA